MDIRKGLLLGFKHWVVTDFGFWILQREFFVFQAHWSVFFEDETPTDQRRFGWFSYTQYQRS